MTRRTLFVFVTTLVSTGVLALAADAPKKVQRQAEQLFPDSKLDIQSGREINGLKTYDVNVEGRNEEGPARASAVLTENGDIVMSSQRRTDGAPTPAVERVAKGLFDMPMNDYDAVSQTYYLIDTSANGRDYQIKIDATGRIRDAQTQRNVEMEDVSQYSKAEGENRDNVINFVKKWHEGAKIGEVYEYTPMPGYYLVQYTRDSGEESQIIMNREGRVYQEITGFSQDHLPRPVSDTLDQVLKGAKINNVTRADINYYEFQREVGDDTLTLRIRPNGEIVQIRSLQGQQADNEARTASERQERED